MNEIPQPVKNIFPPQNRLGTVLSTRGLPVPNVGKNGDLATDPTTGKVYLKSAGLWRFKWQGFLRQSGLISGGAPTIQQQDPPFSPFSSEGSFYLLSASNSGKPNFYTTLNWIFPDFYILFGVLSPHVNPVIKQVILQRSTTTRATPFSATGDGMPDPGYHVVAYGLLPADAAWTTLLDQQISHEVTGPDTSLYPYVTTFEDDTPPDHIFNYRLIVLLDSPTPDRHFETDFNVVTVTKPYAFTIAQFQSDGLHLAWE